MNIKLITIILTIAVVGGAIFYAFKFGNRPIEITNEPGSTSGKTSGETPGKPKAITIGEEVLINGVKLTVRSVSEDSRCPKDVTCVWAGRVTVEVTLQKGGNKQTGPITLGEAVPFEGQMITLVQVDPEKNVGVDVKSGDYRFYFTAKADSGSAGAGPQSDDVSNLIRVLSPKVAGVVTSPLIVAGEARGNWFFEASFPVELRDATGELVASGIATAKGNWMTTDFVPFEAKLTFTKPSTIAGVLILKKDNPSGDQALDASLEVPVKF